MTFKEQIKEGYLYLVGTGDEVIITGSIGALQYAIMLQEQGMPDNVIQNYINVSVLAGVIPQKFTEAKWTPLSRVRWDATGMAEDNMGFNKLVTVIKQ